MTPIHLPIKVLSHQLLLGFASYYLLLLINKIEYSNAQKNTATTCVTNKIYVAVGTLPSIQKNNNYIVV